MNPERLKRPLSQNGLYALGVLLGVAESRRIDNLKDLLLTHKNELREFVKATLPSKRWTSVFNVLQHLRANFGMWDPAFRKGWVRLKDFPPTLKKQWEVLESRATNGWDDEPEMLALAARNGIKIQPLEKLTLEIYLGALSAALSHIPYEGDLDVRDLLKLEPVQVTVDGVTTTRLTNLLVDRYRKKEWQRETERKRIGYDSVIFYQFVTAIKTLAAYNGIFHLQADFRANYSIKLDRETRRKRKTAKKQIYNLQWLDAEIERLEADFVRIIKNDSFKLENYSQKFSKNCKDLRFCLFYVGLVTLRYLGVRQQCISNCIYNRNIVFNADGSIYLRWEAHEIKMIRLLKYY